MQTQNCMVFHLSGLLPFSLCYYLVIDHQGCIRSIIFDYALQWSTFDWMP